MDDRIGDAADIGGAEAVLLAVLDVFPGGVHEEHVRGVPFLPEDHDDGGDARAEEDIRREADDGFDVVILDEVPPDLPLPFTVGIAAEEHAVRQDDGHDAVGLEVVQVVQEEGVVRLAGRREAVAVAGLGLFPGGFQCWE